MLKPQTLAFGLLFQEYLVRTINSNNLDPLDHFSLEDVLVIAQREQKFKGLVIPPKGDDGDEIYKAKLVQV